MVCAVPEFQCEMPIDPLKTIPASAEIQHSAAAHASGIIVSEARFSFFTLRVASAFDRNEGLSTKLQKSLRTLDLVIQSQK